MATLLNPCWNCGRSDARVRRSIRPFPIVQCAHCNSGVSCENDDSIAMMARQWNRKCDIEKHKLERKKIEVIRNLLAIVDEELMPNIGRADSGRLNETLIAARELLKRCD